MRTIAVALLLLCPSLVAQKWTPDTVTKLKPVAEVRVSPDGARVVYTVSESVMTDDKSEVLRHIWMAKTDGSDNVQVTFGDKSSNDPHWLPDSSGFVFTSRRSGKPQLYLLRLRGGEAEPLTAGKLEIATFEIAPDGKSIAFVAADVKEDEEKKAKAKEDYRWVDDDLGLRRLYVMPLDGKREPRKLVGGDFSVGGDAPKLAWSPDSKWIAYERVKSPRPNDWPTSDLMMVNAENGQMSTISATNASEAAAQFSPDGKWIAYTITDDPPHWGTDVRVQLLDRTSGARKDLTATYDAQPDVAGFSADGNRIYVREARGTIDRVYAIDVTANKVVDVSTSDGALNEATLNAAATYLGVVMQSLDKPMEAFVTRADRWAPVQISHVNDAFTKYPVAKTDVVRWKSSDGKEIEGLLTYPIGYAVGKRVPLLLVVHGGPAGVFKQSFLGNYSPFPVAVFAQDGYAVLRVNPRGSSGYGRDFRYANYKDWGGGDFNDLMSGVDHVVGLGVADPDRLGVMGWSYGGFMTSWIIGHTGRFKAAIAGAAVTDLLSFTGTADIPGFIPDYFGGHYWETYDVWKAHSPITFVANVKTPTLIEHGEADDRVPISQSYELYNALKLRGVAVKMLVFPRQRHGFTEPKMRAKVAAASVEWIESHISR